MKRNLQGMTLGELLLVVAIIAILALFGIMEWKKQINRGYDARRKADISKLRRAFEDYYNDHDCYPTQIEWDGLTCAGVGQEFLSTYLGSPIPCDPQTQSRYSYQTILYNGKECGKYQLFAMISDWQDNDVIAHKCGDPGRGCGVTGEPAYNYGITNDGWVVGPGNIITTPVPSPSTTPSAPTATPTPFDVPPGYITCSSTGSCVTKATYDEFLADGCKQWFWTTADCNITNCPVDIQCDRN